MPGWGAETGLARPPGRDPVTGPLRPRHSGAALRPFPGLFFSAVKDGVRVDPGILDAKQAVIGRDDGTAPGAYQFEAGALLAEGYLASGALDGRQSLPAVPADFPFRVRTGLHLVLFPLSQQPMGNVDWPVRKENCLFWCVMHISEKRNKFKN